MDRDFALDMESLGCASPSLSGRDLGWGVYWRDSQVVVFAPEFGYTEIEEFLILVSFRADGDRNTHTNLNAKHIMRRAADLGFWRTLPCKSK